MAQGWGRAMAVVLSTRLPERQPHLRASRPSAIDATTPTCVAAVRPNFPRHSRSSRIDCLVVKLHVHPHLLHQGNIRVMGTLTADCPRLDAHCPHKLATSCRLTSTLNCCACADERAHSRTYRVYIDGIGFVQRGTRWQGYCWFCKGMFAREE
jgi:hypothetical protein